MLQRHLTSAKVQNPKLNQEYLYYIGKALQECSLTCLHNKMLHKEELKTKYKTRQDTVFLILAGVFLGTLTLLNVLGVSRFIDFGSIYLGDLKIPFVVAVGVLPYPITFLCTDLIGELYGKKKAKSLVWIGLLLNIWVLFILWIGGAINPPYLENGLVPVSNGNVPHDYAFYFIRNLTTGAVIASMIAYLFAQFIDVQIFHWLKEKTQGKKLWLRNNVSTLTSQLVDSITVIVITHYMSANGLEIIDNKGVFETLSIYILSSYAFKVVVALLDTIPFYYCTIYLRRYLNLQDT